MCPNELLSERGRFNPIFFFLFLFTTSIAFAQKEQFVGFDLGSAKYIDEKAKGTSIGVFYEIKTPLIGFSAWILTIHLWMPYQRA